MEWSSLNAGQITLANLAAHKECTLLSDQLVGSFVTVSPGEAIIFRKIDDTDDCVGCFAINTSARSVLLYKLYETHVLDTRRTSRNEPHFGMAQPGETRHIQIVRKEHMCCEDFDVQLKAVLTTSTAAFDKIYGVAAPTRKFETRLRAVMPRKAMVRHSHTVQNDDEFSPTKDDDVIEVIEYVGNARSGRPFRGTTSLLSVNYVRQNAANPEKMAAASKVLEELLTSVEVSMALFAYLDAQGILTRPTYTQHERIPETAALYKQPSEVTFTTSLASDLSGTVGTIDRYFNGSFGHSTINKVSTVRKSPPTAALESLTPPKLVNFFREDLSPAKRADSEHSRPGVAFNIGLRKSRSEGNARLTVPFDTGLRKSLSDGSVTSERMMFNLPGLMNITVTPCESTSASQLPFYRDNPHLVYKNFTSPKGLALIFDNVLFCDGHIRRGTFLDEMNIRQLFQKLGYDVLPTRRDLRANGMLAAAQQFATDERHKDCHSCVIVVLTHGEYDHLMGTDYQRVNIHEFRECFNAQRAPGLAEKPKLFFIQACRGPQYDEGYPVGETDGGSLGTLRRGGRSAWNVLPSRTNSQDPEDVWKIPTNGDFLVAHSTIPHYASYRDHDRGSWYIRTICQVFQKHAYNTSVASMLEIVHGRIAEKPSRYKQTPVFENGLTLTPCLLFCVCWTCTVKLRQG